MSGFSSEWLELRAAADRRARSLALLAAVQRRFAAHRSDRAPLRIVDLGAGTGSTLRLLAPLLRSPQHWTLVDDDPALLAVVNPPASSKRIIVRPVLADLAAVRGLAHMLREADLVTASALFDLVSGSWTSQLVRAVARPGRTLYAALTYDGRLSFDPPDRFDGALRALFHRHQRSDKGFGPALGPVAPAALIRLAAAAGATVRAARSDWRLGPGEARLLRALLLGHAAAAREVAPERGDDIACWVARRLAQLEQGALSVRVGHQDMLACW